MIRAIAEQEPVPEELPRAVALLGVAQIPSAAADLVAASGVPLVEARRLVRHAAR